MQRSQRFIRSASHVITLSLAQFSFCHVLPSLPLVQDNDPLAAVIVVNDDERDAHPADGETGTAAVRRRREKGKGGHRKEKGKKKQQQVGLSSSQVFYVSTILTEFSFLRRRTRRRKRGPPATKPRPKRRRLRPRRNQKSSSKLPCQSSTLGTRPRLRMQLPQQQ
jgi:hypothetical protein